MPKYYGSNANPPNPATTPSKQNAYGAVSRSNTSATARWWRATEYLAMPSNGWLTAIGAWTGSYAVSGSASIPVGGQGPGIHLALGLYTRNNTTFTRVAGTYTSRFSGQATSVNSTTVTSSTALVPNAWVGYTFNVQTGTAAGVYGVITANTATTITVSSWVLETKQDLSSGPSPSGSFSYFISGVTSARYPDTSGVGEKIEFAPTIGNGVKLVAGTKYSIALNAAGGAAIDEYLANLSVTVNSGAGTTFPVIYTIPSNQLARCTRLEGPQTANGYTWYKYRVFRGNGTFIVGWIAEAGGQFPSINNQFTYSTLTSAAMTDASLSSANRKFYTNTSATVDSSSLTATESTTTDGWLTTWLAYEENVAPSASTLSPTSDAVTGSSVTLTGSFTDNNTAQGDKLKEFRYWLGTNSGSGNWSSATATTLVSSTALTSNAWVGYTVFVNSSYGVIASNTNSTFTLNASGWTGGTPSGSGSYTLLLPTVSSGTVSATTDEQNSNQFSRVISNLQVGTAYFWTAQVSDQFDTWSVFPSANSRFVVNAGPSLVADEADRVRYPATGSTIAPYPLFKLYASDADGGNVGGYSGEIEILKPDGTTITRTLTAGNTIVGTTRLYSYQSTSADLTTIFGIYQWRGRAYDGVIYSSWSSWNTFSLQPNETSVGTITSAISETSQLLIPTITASFYENPVALIQEVAATTPSFSSVDISFRDVLQVSFSLKTFQESISNPTFSVSEKSTALVTEVTFAANSESFEKQVTGITFSATTNISFMEVSQSTSSATSIILDAKIDSDVGQSTSQSAIADLVLERNAYATFAANSNVLAVASLTLTQRIRIESNSTSQIQPTDFNQITYQDAARLASLLTSNTESVVSEALSSLLSSSTELLSFIELQPNTIIDAEDFNYNFGLIQSILGVRSTTGDIYFSNHLYFGDIKSGSASALTDRPNLSGFLHVGFGAEEIARENGTYYTGRLIDFPLGAVTSRLSGSGWSMHVTPPRISSAQMDSLLASPVFGVGLNKHIVVSSNFRFAIANLRQPSSTSSTSNQTQTTTWTEGTRAKVAGSKVGVRLRSAPGTNSQVLGFVNDGDIVEIIGPSQTATNYTWVPVKAAGLTNVWMIVNYLQVISQPPPIEDDDPNTQTTNLGYLLAFSPYETPRELTNLSVNSAVGNVVSISSIVSGLPEGTGLELAIEATGISQSRVSVYADGGSEGNGIQFYVPSECKQYARGRVLIGPSNNLKISITSPLRELKIWIIGIWR